MLRRTSLLLLACALVPTFAACSSSSDPGGSDAPVTATVESSGEVSAPTSGAQAASATTGPPATALPGDDALEPLGPDALAADHLAVLADLPSGELEGRLEMTLSGLVAFAESVHGTCSHDEATATFSATLADGSALVVQFAQHGGRAVLTAPGIDVRSVFDGPDVRASEGAFTVASTLVTDGTSESSGTLRLAGTCA
jgi:hypothetical protein